MFTRNAARMTLAMALVVAVGTSFGGLGCMGAQPAKSPENPADAIVPKNVTDEQMGAAVYELLANGTDNSQRAMLLAGTVRRQFARAAQRFAAGQRERGVAAVQGALLLVRAGEMRLEMLDPAATKALSSAAEASAMRGQEGPTLAFLRLQSRSLPSMDPKQAVIREHLQALEAWMHDTRQRTDVQNAGADVDALALQSVLEPTPETIKAAEKAVDRWIAASLAFNDAFVPGTMPSDRDEMFEALRALRTGTSVLAAIYLRHGNAAGALDAIDRTEARKVASPEFLDRLQTASKSQDGDAWKRLAFMYAQVTAAYDQSDGPMMSPQLAQAAAWGASVAAYRLDPDDIQASAALAVLLPDFGLAEAVPHVIGRAAKKNPTPEALDYFLAMIGALLEQENRVDDYASAQRVFDASKPLLQLGADVAKEHKVRVLPAMVIEQMAKIHQRHANVTKAKELLEQAVAATPSLSGYHALAALRFQAGDGVGALDVIQKGLQLQGNRDDPLVRGEMYLLAFAIHRAQGNQAKAKAALESTTEQAFVAQKQAKNEIAKALVDRLMARVAYYYNDTAAWKRSVIRLLEQASENPRVRDMALIEATSMSLLTGDVQTGVRVLSDASAGARPEDLVYAALWMQAAQQMQQNSADNADDEDNELTELIATLLQRVPEDIPWEYALARYGLRQINDAQLLEKAKTKLQQTEAQFYIAIRQKQTNPRAAEAKLHEIANGPALDLVETFLASELTQPTSQGTWGKPPRQLP